MITLAETISDAIRGAESAALVEAMEARYGAGQYEGWFFAWEYPGNGRFSREDGNGIEIWCTPDWETFGEISVDVHDSETECIESGVVPFWGVRTADAWFAAVKPYLDKYAPSYGASVARKVAWIREACARELGEAPGYPFFHLNYHDSESDDEALLRIFDEERSNHATDRETILVLCHG